MTELERRIYEKVLNNLGNDMLVGSIVYLYKNKVQAGAKIQMGDASFDIPWDANIVFVDFEPGVNWGHACCYLVVRQDADEIQKLTARMPPFLKEHKSGFRLLWRDPNSPAWAVETNSD